MNGPENLSNLEEDMLVNGHDEAVKDDLMKGLTLTKDLSVNGPEMNTTLKMMCQ